ncbi:HlyD family secretion protein [Ancylobacter polymorphus]|uniref:HlyD family efflux transporter periplasmic adaptor subunit n=1 Tax=Ancylobacter polymorphus TaxID=223390 RepID=A0A9E7CWN9_9HYPH|nr:HlyD family efflux transporter periplasmic adaptor subunit [Ancylobacter polymorphus]UOK72833.1 HlyD family efflux transporter periplasmic adaptor subunit [Ancylobacter polymorphus]
MAGQRRFQAFSLALVLAAALAAPAAAQETGSGTASPTGLAARLQGLIGKLTGNRLPEGIVSTNGRIEAEQVLVAAKLAGRVLTVLVEEGQTVETGQVVARMDTSELEAQLAGAQAQVRRAEKAIAEAEAAIAQRESERTLAQQEHERASKLKESGFGTAQSLDLRQSQLNVALAALKAAHASLDEADAAADAARAEVARVQSLIDDSTLRAPRRGRVEYRLVQSGEVVAAGAPIVTLLDLSDVYMTVFVPARVAGRLAMGDEARIILDPAPDYVVPAKVSFVATGAQFTPKAVETADEREKLMFRVKLRIAPELLRQYEDRVKAGVRGLAYVRTDPATPWPDRLAVKLPQ